MPYPPLSAVSNFFEDLTKLIFPSAHPSQAGTKPNVGMEIINEPKLQLEAEKISGFFNDLVSLLVKKNKIEAYEFNVFDYIKPDELKLSRIIADLLNPNGTHGQQITFLAAFVEAMMKRASQPLQETLIKLRDAIKNNTSHTIIARTEVTTFNDGRRMDIVMDLGGKKGIVIENKPWANDQPVQLMAYAKDAKIRFPDGWVLIYLHGVGKVADEYTLPNKEELKRSGNYLDADYIQFLTDWLRICCADDHSIPEKVRFFLRDFMNYIGKNF